MDKFSMYLLGAVVIILTYLTYLLVKPFLIVLLTGTVLTYLFYPVYKWFLKKTNKPNLSASIMIVLIILIFSIPLLFVLNTLVNESYQVYNTAKTKLESDEVFSVEECTGNMCGLVEYTNAKLESPVVRDNLKNYIKSFATFTIQHASNLLLTIPSKIIGLLVMLFTMFYLFKDGHKLLIGVKKFLPLREKHQTKVFKQLTDIMYAIVYGYLLIAIIQGVLGGLAMGILGFKAPVLWGIVMIILSIIPLVGTGVIWGPAAIYSILMGITTGTSSDITKGIILFIFGLIIISPLDTFIRPKIVGKKANIHPVTVLLGVLGGLALFGFVGIILGPVILALVVTLFKIYKKEQNEISSQRH